MVFRDHLWAHGFAVADAMDTAQRGMGLSWDQAKELITYSAQRAAARDAAAQRDLARRDPPGATWGTQPYWPAERVPISSRPAARTGSARSSRRTRNSSTCSSPRACR